MPADWQSQISGTRWMKRPLRGAKKKGLTALFLFQRSKTAMLSTCAVCGNIFTALAAVQR